MIQVSHMEPYLQGVPESGEDMQQAHRIRATGDSHYQELVLFDKFMLLDELYNSCGQRFLLFHRLYVFSRRGFYTVSR